MVQETRLFRVMNAETNTLVMIANYMTIQGAFKFHALATKRMLLETATPRTDFKCHMHMNGKQGVPCNSITVTEIPPELYGAINDHVS